MKFPPNIIALSERGDELAKSLGYDPDRDDPFALDTPAHFSGSGLFLQEAIATVFDGGDCLQNRTVVSRQRIPASIGMILVRPDMHHVHNEATILLKGCWFTH